MVGDDDGGGAAEGRGASDALRRKKFADIREKLRQLTERLEPVIGRRSPEIWNCAHDPAEAPGLLDAMSRAPAPARIEDLRRDIADRAARLPCAALALARDGALVDLPPESIELRPGDDLLFAGRERARTAMLQIMRNANAAQYVLTGHDRSAGLLGRLLAPPPAARRT